MSSDYEAAEVRYRLGLQIRSLLRVAPALHVELARRVGVGVTDLMALDHITSARGPMGVVELSELLRIRPASATVLVDRLVSSGHVRREPHSTDRRRISLQPTATADDDVGVALAPLVSDIIRISGRLSASDALVISQFLTDLTAALEQFANGSESSSRP